MRDLIFSDDEAHTGDVYSVNKEVTTSPSRDLSGQY